jgi:two-component system cell cycle response regulator DivK
MRRLLVVEDNPLNLEMITTWLEAEGHQVFTAETLRDAYAVFESARPELVLLDIRLGPEDGTNFAVWLRQKSADQQVPVIAVTAHALRDEQERIMKAGCNAVIAKPVGFKLLRAELDRWLGKPSASVV